MLCQGIRRIDVAPGYPVNYNLGYTFAVSETTSLGMTVLGSYKERYDDRRC